MKKCVWYVVLKKVSGKSWDEQVQHYLNMKDFKKNMLNRAM